MWSIKNKWTKCISSVIAAAKKNGIMHDILSLHFDDEDEVPGGSL